MTLEQLARERGFFYSDRSKPCVEAGNSGNSEKFRIRANSGAKEEQCIVNFLGSDIATSSFAMYSFSAAVLVQAITLICLSSFADHGMLSSLLFLLRTETNQNLTKNIPERLVIRIID